MNRSYLIVFGLIALDAYADSPINLCELEVRSAKNFENVEVFEAPDKTTESEQSIIYDWTGDSLVLTLHDQTRTSAIARCVYNKSGNKLIFLNVYSETVITNYPDELKALQSATKEEAYSIAVKLGLTGQQIQWLKWRGVRYASLGYYNPKGKITGLAKIGKSDLVHLDKLHIINLYPVSLIANNKNDNEHYFCVGTSISRVLADRL